MPSFVAGSGCGSCCGTSMLTEKSQVGVVVDILKPFTSSIDPVYNGLSNGGASFDADGRSRFANMGLDKIKGVYQRHKASARRKIKGDAISCNKHQMPTFTVDLPVALLNQVNDEAAEDSGPPATVAKAEEKRSSNFKR